MKKKESMRSSSSNSSSCIGESSNFPFTTATTTFSTFQQRRERMVTKPQMSFPSLTHVFSTSSSRSPIFLSISILTLLFHLIQPGNGLHPPQCQWSLYQDIERLNCLVEPGNNLIVEEEVHGIGPEHAKSLWVQCSDIQQQTLKQDEVLQVDSYFGTEKTMVVTGDTGGFVLSHGVFMSVPNLRDLQLENCKIAGVTPGALSYLPYLQNLTIRAHTSPLPWPLSPSSASASSLSATTLEIKPGVLRGLPELRHLDLSTTSLSSLPNDFLCFLPALNYLNLTGCWLRDFRSIGIAPSDPTNPHNCGNQIKILDLSANHFQLLPPATFATVSKLEVLKIERNSITIAAERALLGLSELKIISLAGNQLTSLPPEFFKENRQLKEIYLQNNSLAVLAPGLFNNLEELVVLDLSNNELTSEWINGETFRKLVRLIVLNLSNNFLSKVDSALLRDLHTLQVLNLEFNRISSISKDAFAGMYNIHSLFLSNNQITQIQPEFCNGLYVLSFLALDNNKIETVGQESFKNCSNLMDLNLSSNKISQIILPPLNLLRTLDMGENKIQDISNVSYLSLPKLYGLRLTDNSIVHVPKDSFSNLPSLKIVNLSKNNISRIEPGAFDNNPNLQAVRLDGNKLTETTEIFKNIQNLLWLNISQNFIQKLEYQDFPSRLQWLDLRANKIDKVGNCLEIDNLRIRNLDISHNLITEIGSSNLPEAIENLLLSHNNIKEIQPYTFFRKSNLSHVDISANMIRLIDQNALRLSPDRVNNNQVPRILLGSNPLNCDCSMEWLKSMNSGDLSGQYPIIQDIDDVKCTLSFDRNHDLVPIMNIDSNKFLCKYESHCFNLCQCCEFEACDCDMICPSNCSCYHNQEWSTNLVDCSSMEQSIIPGRIPMDVTELYLDGLDGGKLSLGSHAFIGRKNLKALYLNSSQISVIQNRTFYGLKSLLTLHLDGNSIERLIGYEFDDLNLEELYLHENALRFIAPETFTALTSLRVLSLHGNNLVDLPIWQMTTGLVHLGAGLTLRGNEWSCECQFATQLKDWLIKERISDASQVHCVDQVSTSSSSSTRGSVLQTGSSGSSNELVVVRLLDQRNPRCLQTTDLSIRERTEGNGDEFDLSGYIPLIVCITGLVLFILVISVLCFYWRKSLRIWMYANCGGLRLEGSCREPHAERDKLFDAFVSYSSKDEAWVRQVFAAELERHDPPYRLCLRYRDLPTGGTYLADTIVQAAEASRRTVLVLSHHFLKGEWSRTDVKSAHHSVLKDRHRKVIIILLGDLPSKDLDPDIRLYMKNHTYLNCEDKKFWDKLRFALPDVRVKVPLFRGANGRTSSGGHNATTNHRSTLPPPPPPHYQYPHNHHQLPPHQPSPNLTSSHHHNFNNGGNSSNASTMNLHNNTQNNLTQQNIMNSLNSVILPNNYNVGAHMSSAPNIVPLVTTSGSQRQSNQQRQYHSIVNSSLSANPNRHTAVHI